MRFPERWSIPDEVLKIARTLAGAGHEVWCVGGIVRDSLLQLEHNGVADLATSAIPEEVQRPFRRTVPLGLKHGTGAFI